MCRKAPCSPGGSSYWAEAHVALGPGDAGLPNSLYHRAPQRLGRKCGLGAHGISGDMTRGARILTRERGPNPFWFIKRQRRTFKAFKRPCPPRFRQTSVMMSCEHLNKEMVLDVHIMYISKDRGAKHDNNSSCELMEQLKHAGRCVTCIS